MRTEVAPPAAEPGGPGHGNVRRSRRITILMVVFMVVVGALWIVGPYVFEGRDDPTAIDSAPVRQAVLAACTTLRSDLAALPAGMAPAERAEAENRAVEQLVARVRAVGAETLADDEPVGRWLADWERIVAARRQAVRDGKRFAMPMSDAGPVNVRMYALVRSGLAQCDVPPALLATEPGRG